ncbi:hypothetical protein GCM10027290_46330 [Micromonospora sonneratiae]
MTGVVRRAWPPILQCTINQGLGRRCTEGYRRVVTDENPQQRLRYRLLTGPDDAAFCQRVSQALADGYQLYGSPALTFDGERVIAAQAVVLPEE